MLICLSVEKKPGEFAGYENMLRCKERDCCLQQQISTRNKYNSIKFLSKVWSITDIRNINAGVSKNINWFTAVQQSLVTLSIICHFYWTTKTNLIAIW